MPKLLIVDPATSSRDGWHNLYGSESDALNGNISRVFLTGVPMSVPTTKCRQPDSWSCGPYALAECLGQDSGEDARQWLLGKGMITSQWGTEYAGIVGYLNANGYSCEYDGRNYDGVMNGAIYDKIVSHLRSGYKIILCMHHDRTNYWTNNGHYITVYGIDGEGIDVDGLWGNKTTTFAQKVFHTTEDGIISNQNKLMIPYLPCCQPSSWEFVSQDELKNGSELIRAIQRLIGATEDGFFGNESVLMFNKYFLDADDDAYIGYQSVGAFQQWLNSHA